MKERNARVPYDRATIDPKRGYVEALLYALAISPASCQRDICDVHSLNADATSRMKNAYMVISTKDVISAIIHQRMILPSSNREVFVTNSLSSDQWSLLASSNPSSHLSADPSASGQPPAASCISPASTACRSLLDLRRGARAASHRPQPHGPVPGGDRLRLAAAVTCLLDLTAIGSRFLRALGVLGGARWPDAISYSV